MIAFNLLGRKNYYQNGLMDIQQTIHKCAFSLINKRTNCNIHMKMKCSKRNSNSTCNFVNGKRLRFYLILSIQRKDNNTLIHCKSCIQRKKKTQEDIACLSYYIGVSQ